MDNSSAERQRRYMQRLKDRAIEPHAPDLVLAALAKLQPQHFAKGGATIFAQRVIAEAERLLAASDSNAASEITALHAGLDWSGNDGEGCWLAKSGEIVHEVKHPTPENGKWTVMVYEGDASQSSGSAISPTTQLRAAKTAAEQDFAARVGGVK